jgi:succinyl-CoA synthetase beta subunit
MNLHEYQTKSIFKEYGIPVPEGRLAETPEQARAAFEELGVPLVAVKAQIHAGGRGKGGGVKLAKSADEAEQVASDILGMQLVTHQTGPEGKEVLKVWVEAGSDIQRELYVGIVLDRVQGCPVMMVSEEGGMDIEEVAEKTPEKIHKEPIHIHQGLLPFQLRRLVYFLNFPKEQQKAAMKVLSALRIRRGGCARRQDGRG